MTRTALLIIVAAGCGGSARSSTPLGNAAGTGGERPAAVACPTGAELEALAKKAWNATVGTITSTCVAVRAGEPLWLIDGYVERDSDEGSFVDEHTALVAPDGTVRSLESNPDMPPSIIDRNGATYTAVDLDGDGRDELLLEGGYMHGGYEDSWLTAVGIAPDGTLARSGEGGTLPLAADNSAADPDPADAYSCDSTHELIDRPGGGKLVEIVGQPPTGAVGEQSCPKPGRHVYGWNGTQLVELAAP